MMSTKVDRIIIIYESDDNESIDDYIEYQEENKIKNQNLIQARTDFGMCTVDDKLVNSF